MKNADWRMSDARLTQSVGNQPFLSRYNWRKSRLAHNWRTTDATCPKNGGKLRLARNVLRARGLRVINPLSGGITLGRCVRAREADAAAGVGMFRFGYTPDAPLGCFGEVG